MDDEIEEIKEKLEEESGDFAQDQMYDQWEEAHEKYDNGDPSMLKNLLGTKERLHEHDTLAELKKKGQNLNYDKLDSSLTAIILTSSSFIIHPVIISGWLTVFYKILVDSKRNVSEGNKWERLNDFGPELLYYLASTLGTVYFFITIQEQSIVLENGGTFMQILVEVMRFAGL